MGWWNRSFAGGLSSQATTSQRVTAIGGHPGYNDNRVEIAPAAGASAPSTSAAVPEPVG
jgi:hypothetical protein